MATFYKKIWAMYRDGFRSMTVGRSLWWLIIIKIILIFGILKLFFFQDKLTTEYDNDTARAAAVRRALTQNE